MDSIDLAPNEKECMRQLFFGGPTWDGDIVSKAGRAGLSQRGYVERENGWTQLTWSGFVVAVRAGLGDDKQRRDNRRRRDDNDRHRAIVALVDYADGSFVLSPADRTADLDVSRDSAGYVRFALAE